MSSNLFVKNLGIRHNVSIDVFDEKTGKLLQHHQGHNCATNSMLTGIGHYLVGDGIFNQGYEMLRYWVPQYMSLGTMGLASQEEDPDTGLPLYIGSDKNLSDLEQCKDYMSHMPGYTADGYDDGRYNNGRTDNPSDRIFLGLGPKFEDRPDKEDTIKCELVSSGYTRSKISYRELVDEIYAELPNTIDVALSAMISTGSLKQFRSGDRDYIFITEAGLWSTRTHISGGDNGLLAGYRIVPSDTDKWDMNVAANRKLLRSEILRVGFNQVVQIVWKIQIGAIEDLQRVSRD